MWNKWLTKRNVNVVVFLIALMGMSGSLYYSEVVGLTPCLMCWYQRIAMYPIVLLALVAVIRKSRELPYFVLPLSIIGIILSGYHYILQRTASFADLATPCSLTGPSCTGIYVQYFGFITIPFLALVGFICITGLMLLSFRLDR